jgi:hypothetical protein
MKKIIEMIVKEWLTDILMAILQVAIQILLCTCAIFFMLKYVGNSFEYLQSLSFIDWAIAITIFRIFTYRPTDDDSDSDSEQQKPIHPVHDVESDFRKIAYDDESETRGVPPPRNVMPEGIPNDGNYSVRE